MKTAKFTWVILAIITATLFAFTVIAGGSVKGTINPANGASKAWAISETDTFQTDISSGSFEIKNVKQGTYTIMIAANAPYKNVTKEGVQVIDGAATDIGEIKLNQ